MFALARLNWKTTVAGVSAFIVVMLNQVIAQLDSSPETIADWNLAIGAFLAMLGLWNARDDNKSSEAQYRVQRAAKRKKRT